jgi:hypothetical protein
LDVDSIKIGNILLDTSRAAHYGEGNTQLQIRQAGDGLETGVIFKPDWHTSRMWKRRDDYHWDQVF